MVKKGILAAALMAFLAAGVFSQEGSDYKHQASDMLIGFNVGLGVTPNIGGLIEAFSNETAPVGNYAFTSDSGLTFDYYLFSWLSFNTGLFIHPDIYMLLDQDLTKASSGDAFDYVATPICLTIPLAVHVNIPGVEWLYAGVGLSLNLPIVGLLDKMIGLDTKGKFFVGLPVDLGFDFIRPGGGGARFFFRITPEFHAKGTTVPIGFIWQIWNWKIFGLE